MLRDKSSPRPKDWSVLGFGITIPEIFRVSIGNNPSIERSDETIKGEPGLKSAKVYIKFRALSSH